jgi:hypothetical protein
MEGRSAERLTDEIRQREIAEKLGWKRKTGARQKAKTSEPTPRPDSRGSLESAD